MGVGVSVEVARKHNPKKMITNATTIQAQRPDVREGEEAMLNLLFSSCCGS